MDEKEIPVVAGIGQTFHNCTILIHVGNVSEFKDLVREFVEEGLITPSVADQMLGEDDDRKP